MRRLFEGGAYSRAALIRVNTVFGAEANISARAEVSHVIATKCHFSNSRSIARVFVNTLGSHLRYVLSRNFAVASNEIVWFLLFTTTPFPVILQIWKAIACITSAFSGAKNQVNFLLVTDRTPFAFESRISCRRLESVLKGLRLFRDCCF